MKIIKYPIEDEFLTHNLFEESEEQEQEQELEQDQEGVLAPVPGSGGHKSFCTARTFFPTSAFLMALFLILLHISGGRQGGRSYSKGGVPADTATAAQIKIRDVTKDCHDLVLICQAIANPSDRLESTVLGAVTSFYDKDLLVSVERSLLLAKDKYSYVRDYNETIELSSLSNEIYWVGQDLGHEIRNFIRRSNLREDVELKLRDTLKTAFSSLDTQQLNVDRFPFLIETVVREVDDIIVNALSKGDDTVNELMNQVKALNSPFIHTQIDKEKGRVWLHLELERLVDAIISIYAMALSHPALAFYPFNTQSIVSKWNEGCGNEKRVLLKEIAGNQRAMMALGRMVLNC